MRLLGKNNGGRGYSSFENICVRVERLEMEMRAVIRVVNSNRELAAVYRKAMEEEEANLRRKLELEERNAIAVKKAREKAAKRLRFIP